MLPARACRWPFRIAWSGFRLSSPRRETRRIACVSRAGARKRPSTPPRSSAIPFDLRRRHIGLIPKRPGHFGLFGWTRGHSRLGHPSVGHKPGKPAQVDLRPCAAGTPRRETLTPGLVVDSLDLPVNPPETQRLLDGFDVGHARLAGMGLVVREPQLLLPGVVALEPSAPECARDRMKTGLTGTTTGPPIRSPSSPRPAGRARRHARGLAERDAPAMQPRGPVAADKPIGRGVRLVVHHRVERHEDVARARATAAAARASRRRSGDSRAPAGSAGCRVRTCPMPAPR